MPCMGIVNVLYFSKKKHITPEQPGILYGAGAKFSAQSLGRGTEIQYGGV